MATIVTWVQDANSRYEISSPEHLIQLMNQGTVYTDAGSFPTSYWSSAYIQTQDIDLSAYHSSIVPIGYPTAFTGEYNGDEYKISNWSYTSTTTDEAGLFGYVSGGKLHRIRLTGVWVLVNHEYSGFLCGRAYHSSSIYDIDSNFDVGTNISDVTVDTTSYAGVLIGRLDTSDAYGLTVRGTIDVVFTAYITLGGIIGMVAYGSATMLRNIATFSNLVGILNTGGVFGRVFEATVTHAINGMIGNVIGRNAGGVIGSSNNECIVDMVVNSMRGDITGGEVGSVGGIIGSAISSDNNNFVGTRMLNYMSGNISGSFNSVRDGGIVGKVSRSASQPIADSSISDSIVAMDGTVEASVVGEQTYTPSLLTATAVDTYGLVAGGNSNSTTVFPSNPSIITHPDFAELPYFELTGTDPDGTLYEWDFIYGNVGGRATYSLYTHMVIHKDDIIHPLLVDFDIVANNTTAYSTFINYTNDVVQSALTVFSIGVPPPLTVVERAISINVRIGRVDGATGYRVTYEGPTGGEVTFVTDTTSLFHIISNVTPETVYTIRLYVHDGTGYVLTENETVTTLANVAESYDVNDFKVNGVFNLLQLPESVTSSMSTISGELFTTGDVVNIVRTDPLFKSTFVNLGEFLNIKDVNGVLIPFESATGPGQSVNVILSDNVTVENLSYNDTDGSITVGTQSYFPGDTFILNGKKAKIVDV